MSRTLILHHTNILKSNKYLGTENALIFSYERSTIHIITLKAITTKSHIFDISLFVIIIFVMNVIVGFVFSLQN